jgi:two-component system, cell cycle sensor histidine kinase and response regulator CckA
MAVRPSYNHQMPTTGDKPTILYLGGAALAQVLRREGFTVRDAGSEAEALRLAGERPELIVLEGEVCTGLDIDLRIPVVRLAEDSAPGLVVATVQALLRALRAEQGAQDAAREWEATFDAIAHGICLLDSAGRIRRVNRTMCGFLGMAKEEAVGKRHQDVPPGSLEPEAGWPFERARKSLRIESAEVQAGERWFHMTVNPLLDASGAFTGAVRAIVDMTERKRAEQERERLLRQLEDERARLETLLRQMPSGVILAEAPSGKLAMINAQVESIFRGPFRIGGGIDDYLQYPAFRPTGRAYRPEEYPLTRSIATGETIAHEEIQFLRVDGTRATVLVNSAPIRGHDGVIIAGVLTLDDVTERSQLEHQLRQSQKMEAMGRLAGGVAHDFNNLLTIIGGYGQMVMDSLKAKDPARKDLEAVLEASTRATDLTRRLLTFSRRQPIQPKVLDLNRQVSRINRMLERVIGEDIELVISLQAEPSRIKADPAQIEQVLLNLAVNARDAMPKGGKLVIETARFDSANAPAGAPPELKPGRYVTLAVIDTGTGMDAETQTRLFEPFFTTKGKGKGTGLGLSTVYGIVKQSGGEIAIESEVGRGTAVRSYFPCAEERVKAGPAARRPVARMGTETILLVEDDATVRGMASEMLARRGYSVLEAASEAEALGVWRERGASIDLLLTDVIMPQTSGPQLAAQLLAARPGLKVLYMSGYADDVLKEHGAVEALPGFLHKPFTSSALAQKVRAVLDEKSKP